MNIRPIALALSAVLAAAPALAQDTGIPAALQDKVKQSIDADQERLVGLYKDLHQNPELGFMETRTADIVAKELKALGFEVKTGIAKTGVVGILRNGEGPTVMFRADMDANAVAEATGLPFASKVRVKRPGGEEVPVAHMCGHDAHVTWMLGLARTMVNLKKDWSGTLVLVAQPAEEPILGAQAMVDDGLYTKFGVPVPDAFVALHTVIGPTGKIAARGGVIEAGTDQLDVTFHGVGAHGSQPNLSKDPVIMAAAAIMQYQTIVSRVIDPRDMGVVTVGAVQAGADNNTIPDSALLKLNLRFFDLKVRDTMLAGIKSINNGIARTYGIPEDKLPSVVMKGYAPPLDNDAALIGRITPSLAALIGQDNVVDEFPASTGSEDAHLLRGPHDKVPVAYMLVGVVEPNEFMDAVKAGKPGPYANHMPNFKVDLNAIPLGAKAGTVAVLAALVK
jgi:hippurate hydrolase